MDKLQSIKQKYGYTSKSITNPSSTSKNTPIPTFIDTKSYSSAKKSNTSSQFKPSNGSYYVDTNTPKISCFDTFNQSQLKKNQNESTEMYISFGNNHKNPLSQRPHDNNSNTKCTQNIIKNYQNTYDLLTNYRKRIRCSIQKDNKQTKLKVIPIQNKQNITMFKQNKPSYRKQHSSSTKNNEESSFKSHPKRCSPLEGIDVSNFVNVHHEIDNISRLQSRIYELLKEKTH